MKYLGRTDERSVKDFMMSYLPKYYQDSKVVNEIMRVDSDEMERYYGEVKKVLDEFFINSATSTLDRKLKEFSIKEDPSVVRTTAEKRALLMLKIRSMRTVTKKILKDMVAIYDGGDTEIIEGTGMITIRFTSVYGTPLRIQDLTVALRDIIPAHLDFRYQYMYTTWDQVDGKNYTWDTVDSKTLLWDNVDGGGLS